MALAARIAEKLTAAWHGRSIILKATSFGLVGVINTAIDAGVFFLALAFATDSLVIANVSSWLVAVTCSYAMNSMTTFAHESRRKLRWRDYGTFVASGIAGFTVNTIVLLIVATMAPVWIAKGCALVASFVVNFSLSNFVVFRRRQPADGRH